MHAATALALTNQNQPTASLAGTVVNAAGCRWQPAGLMTRGHYGLRTVKKYCRLQIRLATGRQAGEQTGGQVKTVRQTNKQANRHTPVSSCRHKHSADCR